MLSDDWSDIIDIYSERVLLTLTTMFSLFAVKNYLRYIYPNCIGYKHIT